MSRRQLPIGIQDFRTLRENGCYYVDKTPLIDRLERAGRHYFLSRPRRFGKSLLIDTLGELFACSEPLFRGLHIHDRWDWRNPHPVVRLSFGGSYRETAHIEGDIIEQLESVERRANLETAHTSNTGPRRLRSILDRLHQKTGRQVVVLVDEYDKPILDVLDDPGLARANREYLRGFYGVIKDCAAHVRFVFVTGVSMFTKVSLFSGLNHLENISLDPHYATICGYTDRDLDTVFSPELDGLDRDEIRRWYNGYHWLGDDRLYNPFDILLLFRGREFEPHWFETGTPTMLYRQISEERTPPLAIENSVADAGLITKFDIGEVDLRALMFQAGYLTIAKSERIGTETFYTLEFPNLEVRQSFSKGLLVHTGVDGVVVSRQANALIELLVSNDFEGFAERLRAYLSGIPHQWYDSSGIERYEAHYASMLYLSFRAIGVDLVVEDASNHGRADMVVFRGGQVFAFEFKMAGDGEAPEAATARALEQMRDRGYADKHRDRGEPIFLLAVVFGRDARNLLSVTATRA